jgi:hypothetical protein
MEYVTDEQYLQGKNEQRRSKQRQFVRQSGVFAVLRVFDGDLLGIRRRGQVWMRTLRICCRGFDATPGGTNSLLDFLFTRRQRVVRDVQRALLYFGFGYAVQRFDGVGYFLLTTGIAKLPDFNSSDHGFGQCRVCVVRVFVHVF